MERHRSWFKDIQLFSRFLGKYEYFGTFRFREDIDMSWEQSQKSISHFKSIVRQKLFGRRGDFKLNFLSVIEDKKWEKNTKRYVSVKTHFHFLISNVGEGTRLNKDFREFLIDCWDSLQESGERDKQQVKFIYSGNSLSEDYILKLRHSKTGIRFYDDVNSTQSQEITSVDVDFGDGIEVHEITGDFVEFLDEIEESRTNLN
jgi:hypothetical protein